MDVTEQLQAYTDQLVALGRATLARQRHGEWLPDELVGPAEALLALERAFGAPPADESADEVAIALAEPAAPADWSPPADEAPAEETPAEETPVEAVAADEPPAEEVPVEAVVADEAPVDEAPVEEAPDDESSRPITTVLDEHPGVEHIPTMSPIEADNWLSALENDPSGMPILPAPEAGQAAPEEYLVIDVDEEAGGGPAAVASPSDALPPLVVNSMDMLGPTNVFGESDSALHTDEAETAAPSAPVAEGEAPAPASPAPELRFCTNCGAELRPGRRFCFRCGASVADMLAEVFPDAAPPAASVPAAASAPAESPPWDAPPPPPPPLAPTTDEWPPFVSDAPRYTPGALPAPVPAMARFCNNCGLGLDAGVTVCPDCGSRDIS